MGKHETRFNSRDNAMFASNAVICCPRNSLTQPQPCTKGLRGTSETAPEFCGHWRVYWLHAAGCIIKASADSTVRLTEQQQQQHAVHATRKPTAATLL
jgi:hypothetical protein